MAGIPPWHLWGDSKLLEPISGGPASGSASSTQIVRISYGRPDTWRFLFAAQIVGFSGAGGAPISPGNCVVTWNVTTGVGRVSTTMPSFERYKFQWLVTPSDVLKFSADVIGPVRDDSAAALVDNNNRIDQLIGEDIQVQATAQLTTPAAGDAVQVQVYAFFSPNVHVRPEWFEQRFPGDETEGR